MKKFASMTTSYALAHFFVDFSCAYFIFSLLNGTSQWIFCLLIYNFCAFALQMPIGIISDKLNKNRYLAALGCVLIMSSSLFASIPFVLSAIAGLGNALFHIGAGRDVLSRAQQRFSALGVFVSPGAAGLYLGILWGKKALLPTISVLGVLFIVSLIIFFCIPMLYDDTRLRNTSLKVSLHRKSSLLFILFCLLAVVCLRSFIGMSLSFPWKREGYFALILTVSVVFGKASGGVLADRFGAFKVSYISLSLCVLLSFFYKTPICGILAIFFFNMTMPITLGAVTKLFPSALGFGFGLLTFGLFLGFIPIIIGSSSTMILPYGFAAACIISIILLYFGLKEPQYAARYDR